MSASDGGGVYAQVKVDKKDAEILSNLIWYAVNGLVVNPSKVVKPKDYHSTLLYSRKGSVELSKPKSDAIYSATIKNLELWTEHDIALVATLDCPKLVKRHEQLMSKNPDLEWDYPEYKPHITICYDLKFGPRILQRLKNILVGQTVTLVNEKIEPLDTEHKDTE
jgi:hypothetical protein